MQCGSNLDPIYCPVSETLQVLLKIATPPLFCIPPECWGVPLGLLGAPGAKIRINATCMTTDHQRCRQTDGQTTYDGIKYRALHYVHRAVKRKPV